MQPKLLFMLGIQRRQQKQQGYKLKHQLQDQIEDQVKKVLIQKIPAALNWVSDLAESAQSEAVRLGAIKRYSRQGWYETCRESGANQYRKTFYKGVRERIIIFIEALDVYRKKS